MYFLWMTTLKSKLCYSVYARYNQKDSRKFPCNNISKLQFYTKWLQYILQFRAVGTGGRGAPPSVFGRPVNPISTRGADYAHHITTCPLGFSVLLTALYIHNILFFSACFTAWKYEKKFPLATYLTSFSA